MLSVAVFHWSWPEAKGLEEEAEGVAMGEVVAMAEAGDQDGLTSNNIDIFFISAKLFLTKGDLGGALQNVLFCSTVLFNLLSLHIEELWTIFFITTHCFSRRQPSAQI